jgi:hypothetical protein
MTDPNFGSRNPNFKIFLWLKAWETGQLEKAREIAAELAPDDGYDDEDEAELADDHEHEFLDDARKAAIKPRLSRV